MKCPFPSDGGEPIFESAMAEVIQGGVYQFKCSQGHENTIILQDEPYQVLFEIAVQAIADGYYREAVSSAAAALERFFEFAARFLLLERKVPFEVVRLGWNEVSAQSERQLGLFIGTFVSRFGAMPSLLPRNGSSKPSAEFRNAVIHKGHIPTRKEALDFVEKIFEIVKENLDQLKTAGDITMLDFSFHNSSEKISQYPETHTTLCLSLLLNPLAKPGADTRNVAERIAYILEKKSEDHH